jgi:hypothetical protein
MAFHPFQTFRKRQKTLLAILTIFVMFIFILSYSGRGDALDTIMSWISGRTRKDKTEVTELYGSTVTVGEMDQLLQHRRMADAFIKNAILQGQPRLSDTEHQEVLGKIIDFLRQEDQFGGMGTMRFKLLTYKQQLLKEGKTDAARFVAHWMRSMELNGWAQMHPGQLYFGGGTSPDDLLDFMIWRKQADRLNIALTDDDLRKEINHEADSDVLSGDQNKDADKLRLYVQGVNRSADSKDVYAALRDEYRVRLAKEVLLGSSAGARAASDRLAGDEAPAGGTPAEFWDFFKDKRTELKVDFLKVPVSQFTAQVKEPDDKAKFEKELDDLFRRYKKEEPSPDRSTPGFTVPRRVKVEWVEADPNSAHYRQAARKALFREGDEKHPILSDAQPLTLLTILPASIASPAGVAGVLAPAALPTVEIPHLQFEYEAYVMGMKSAWDGSALDADGTSPHALGLRRTETVAAVLGQVGGALATQAPWQSVDATLPAITAVQRKEQAERRAAMILAGANPFPLAIAAQQASLVNVRVPPLSAVRGDMATRLRERIAPGMAKAALDAFIKDLDAKRTKPNEAAEYVAKNANVEHGITGHDVMTEARDQAEIADSPQLVPLKKAEEGKRAEEPADPMAPPVARQFAQKLFAPNQLYHPEPLQTDLFRQPTSGSRFYYWLTENNKPSTPTTLADARPRVEAAWKFNQARKDARQEAERIVEDLKKRGQGIAADRYLKDEAERLKAAHPGAGYQEFEPTLPIAKLVSTPLGAMPRRSLMTEYEPYRFEESKIAYPRADTVEELFKALKEPGDAVVITDRPERNYYVAVLKERVVPTEKEFFDVYRKAPRSLLSDTLWARFQAERERQYRADVMRHLREEARAPLDEQGNYKLDPTVRRRVGGGSGGDE